MEKLPERKDLRLKEYDYAAGWYFVTICTAGRKCIFGHVVGGDAHIAPQMALSTYGKTVEQYIKTISGIDSYVIMPNHVHFVVSIGAENGSMWASTPTKTLGSLVRSFKTMVTKAIGEKIWQRYYYDHVIRNEADYLRIRQYMDNNPAQWAEDVYYEFS